MERPVDAVRRMVGALLPFVHQLASVNPLRRLLHQTLPYRATLRSVVPGSMRITIELDLKIFFQDGAAVPENVVGAVEPPEPAEAEVNIPAIGDMIPDVPAADAPLLGSLHGILDLHDP